MKPAQVVNLGFSRDDVISMDAERAKQFMDILFQMSRRLESLNAAADLMQTHDLGEGEMCAASTVRAFCKPLIEDLARIYEYVDNEEKRPTVDEGGGNA